MRELENVIRQVIVLTDAQRIEPEDLLLPLLPASLDTRGDSLKQAKAKVMAQFEQAYIAELLLAHEGNVTQAALEAQTERRAFGRLVKKYQLAKR
jgi:two-component system response regulator GlrR